MKSLLRQGLHHLVILPPALWWGSLTALGAMVVPMLFVHLPSPAMAGNMAAKLFAAQFWLSMACGFAIMLGWRLSSGFNNGLQAKAHPALPWLLLGLLSALIVYAGIAPRIELRQNLALWHRLGTGLFVLQWVCAAIVLLKSKSTVT